MASYATPLLDHPDPRLRPEKAVWRQLRSVIAAASRVALAKFADDTFRVSLIGEDMALGLALEVEIGMRVDFVDAAALVGPPMVRDHVTVVALPPRASAAERLNHLHNAYLRVRPAGCLVVVATVVADPDEQDVSTPSMSELYEELQRATGVGVTIDELRSLRWSNEPMCRGVVLSATSLSTSRAEEDAT